MKKSFFLLLFVCMSVGFNAYGAENMDPTRITGDDLAQHNDLFANGTDEHHIHGRPFYQLRALPSPADNPLKSILCSFVSEDGQPRYVKVVSNGDAHADLVSVEYCDKDGEKVYGAVLDEDNKDVVLPDLSSLVPLKNDGDSSVYTIARLLKKPAIIVAVSATSAGATYAITKFINKQWNKKYNAKKVATFSGIGAGVMTGVYLYWPTAVEVEA